MKGFVKQVLPVFVFGLLVMITSANTEDGDVEAVNQTGSSSESAGESNIRSATFGLG